MLLIYGAYGYSGRLIVQEATERGLRPVLSGRDASALQSLAADYGLEARPASLSDQNALDRALSGITVVLNCAGPFSQTWKPVVDACLRARAHYLDITGEARVFEECSKRETEARSRGVMLLPGTGFDVVPSDCLAARLAGRMPDAVELSLAFFSSGGHSRGTALTAIESMGKPGLVRREGRMTEVPAAYHRRMIDFGEGPRLAVTIPWGDVSTAYHSTGIPNVRVYMAMLPKQERFLRMSRWIGWFLRSRYMQERMAARVKARPDGPDEESRALHISRFWGEVRNSRGDTMVSRIRAPEAYTLTANAAVRCVEHVLAGNVTLGFQTPSRAFGADLVLELDGVQVLDD